MRTSRPSDLLRSATVFCLSVGITGCASGHQELRRQRAEDIAHWQTYQIERVGPLTVHGGEDAPVSALSERMEPRLVCRNGTLSNSCTRSSTSRDCCIDQGGVYRDAWGDVRVAR